MRVEVPLNPSNHNSVCSEDGTLTSLSREEYFSQDALGTQDSTSVNLKKMAAEIQTGKELHKCKYSFNSYRLVLGRGSFSILLLTILAAVKLLGTANDVRVFIIFLRRAATDVATVSRHGYVIFLIKCWQYTESSVPLVIWIIFIINQLRLCLLLFSVFLSFSVSLIRKFSSSNFTKLSRCQTLKGVATRTNKPFQFAQQHR